MILKAFLEEISKGSDSPADFLPGPPLDDFCSVDNEPRILEDYRFLLLFEQQGQHSLKKEAKTKVRARSAWGPMQKNSETLLRSSRMTS
jgi:hypothetical protein